MSDHRPLIAEFQVFGGRRDQHERKIKQREYLPPIFDKNDGKMCHELDNTLAKFLNVSKHPIEMTTKEMDVMLEEISTLSANTVRKYNMRRNSSYNSKKKAMKGGWSPQMRVLTAQLTALIEIRRHLSGFARRERWRGAEQRKRGVEKLIGEWSKVADSIKWKSVEAKEAALSLAKPMHFWIDNEPTIESVVNEINVLLGRLHGRKRQEARERISSKTKLREQKRKEGKLGKVIKSVVGKKQLSFDMSWLRTSATSILTCPIEILLALNEAFRIWHAGGEDALTGLNKPREDWTKLLDDREQFDEAIADEKIPEHIIEIIWKAFQSTRSKLDAVNNDNTLRKEFADLLATPTLDEFKEACKNSSGGKAGGMSGLTYNIVNSWSVKVVTIVYLCITGLKKAGVHPSHWMWKWLAPMPKIDGDITVKDLRPLTLIEVTRKIWTSITVKKIWNFLEKISSCTLLSTGTEEEEEPAPKQRSSLMCSKSVWKATQIWGYRRGTRSGRLTH